jgi:crotonobetainyl-CoA:carnitine CoA-transferase CaiB-like acyl-CoA transferase
MDHPEYDGLKLAAAPVQFDNQPAQIRRSAPRLGEHSEQILAEIGYSPDEISELVTSQVVTSAPA